MTTAIQPVGPPAALLECPPGRTLRRFSVDEYQRMIEAGILADGDRVELLEGWIVQKMGQNPPHSSAATKLSRFLHGLLPDAWTLRCQMPLALPDSMPDPDFAMVRGPDSRYDARHPKPSDVGFVVEVSDSSLQSDQTDKVRMYARAGVPEYWLVNVVDRVVECYSNPVSGATPRYRNCIVRASGDAIPVILDGVAYGEIAVKDFLP